MNLMEGINREDIKPGIDVEILLKKDQRTGKLTRGVVRDILTRSARHLHGIKVRLAPFSFYLKEMLLNILLILAIITAFTCSACVTVKDPSSEFGSSSEETGKRTYLSILTALEKGGDTIDYDTLMHVYSLITQSKHPIPHIDDLLKSLITKRNSDPRIDQMILIFAARAVGDSKFPIPGAYEIFESILRMEDKRINGWVISFVSASIGNYFIDIPDGDRLADLLEEKFDQIEPAHTSSDEYFGFHFLPPPQSHYIRYYIASIEKQRTREIERSYYYLLIQNNYTENEVETSLKHILTRGIPGTGERCVFPMRYLSQNIEKVLSVIIA